MNTLMKPLAIAAMSIAMLAPAKAGDTSCRGTLTVGPEWVTVPDEATVPLPRDHPRYTPNVICRVKTGSPIAKRILRICTDGQYCDISLSIANKPKDYTFTAPNIYTIVKWPEGGVSK
jgi:hypothetical protein